MKNAFFPLLLLFLFLFSQCARVSEASEPGPIRVGITDWEFRQSKEDSGAYEPASVPGTVLPTLFKLGEIPDPFSLDNEKELAWIGQSDWEYRSEFALSDELLLNKNIFLVFEGLDTYADVLLNGRKILSAENMFVSYELPVKEFLKEGKNELIVHFSSPVIQDSIQQARHPFRYPDSRSFTRKAPYQYGWDWGPRLIDMGIWRPVYLDFFDVYTIDQIHVVTDSIVEQQAFVSLILDIHSSDSCRVDLSTNLKSFPDGQIDRSLAIHPGKQRIKLPFTIEEPKLWWPNGMGDPHLYDLNLSLESSDGRLDTSLHFGIREIDLVQKEDSIGRSFYFLVNKEPLFIRGSNYIPQNSFPTLVTKRERRKLLKDAAKVGMNMLRVWGGGIYPENDFYDLCDSLGLLIWQDFMFACNFYPGNEAFLNNIRQEITQQVQRLDGRTCLALWCGNNEIDEAWHNWGYQEALNYSEEDQKKIWGDYQTVFDTLIPGVILANGLRTDYVPSSPKIGWGNQEALYEGDMHYWGVWWGEEPFEKYWEKTGRFMSEYGFQSFPSPPLMATYFYQDSLRLDHPSVLNHQKHPRGMELISKYMDWDYKGTSDPLKYAYISQLVQRRGMRMAIEAHRLKKPYCMGTLYWQLNDCWPAISWSSIDYECQWKAFHFDLQKLYANQSIIVKEKEKIFEVYLVNEDPAIEQCTVRMQIRDLRGKTYVDSSEVVWAPSTYNPLIVKLTKQELTSYAPLEELFLEWSIIHQKQVLQSSRYFLVKPKDLALNKASLELSYFSKEGQSYLMLKSKQLIKDLYLNFPGKDWSFDQNYFDLLGEESVLITGHKNEKQIERSIKDLQAYSLNPELEIFWQDE
jgi:beta-mannosidase